MITDIQKASIWKRASAGLFDLIMIAVFAVGCIFVLSAIFKYDAKQEEVKNIYLAYEERYGFNFLDVSEEDYNKYTEEQKANYDTAYQELIHDQEYLRKYNLTINLTLLMIVIGALVGVIIVELIPPLLFKNGQTLGKKAFSIGVIKQNGVKIRFINLFARTLIGKYAIEIMIPVYCVVMFVFQQINLFIIFVLAALVLTQIIFFITNRYRTLIHDAISYTVVIDMNEQMIFDTEEQLIKYKEANAQKSAEKERAGYLGGRNG